MPWATLYFLSKGKEKFDLLLYFTSRCLSWPWISSQGELWGLASMTAWASSVCLQLLIAEVLFGSPVCREVVRPQSFAVSCSSNSYSNSTTAYFIPEGAKKVNQIRQMSLGISIHTRDFLFPSKPKKFKTFPSTCIRRAFITEKAPRDVTDT